MSQISLRVEVSLGLMPFSLLPVGLLAVAGGRNTLADQLEQLTGHMDAEVGRRTVALKRKAGQLRAVDEVGRQVAAVLETDVLLRTVTSVVRGYLRL